MNKYFVKTKHSKMYFKADNNKQAIEVSKRNFSRFSLYRDLGYIKVPILDERSLIDKIKDFFSSIFKCS